MTEQQNPTPQTIQYRGQIRHESLPEMLFKIYRHRVPGVMVVKYRDVVKQVYIKDGYVIYARSTDRHDSLGEYLRLKKLVSSKDLKAVTRARKKSQQRVGVLLMERGLLSPRQLYDAIRSQIEIIAWSLFSMEDGEVTFHLQELREQNAVRIHVPVRQMILQGIKQAPNAKSLVSRLGSKETVFEACFQAEDLIDIGLDEREAELLKLVDGKHTLFDVIKAGPFDLAENAKVLYAFRVLNLIRPRETDKGIKIRLHTKGATSST